MRENLFLATLSLILTLVFQPAFCAEDTETMAASPGKIEVRSEIKLQTNEKEEGEKEESGTNADPEKELLEKENQIQLKTKILNNESLAAPEQEGEKKLTPKGLLDKLVEFITSMIE